jgi:hypothetical protein
MSYIHYSGVGCNNNGIHTVDEFLNIMKYAPLHYNEMTFLGFNMEYKDYRLPDDFINFTLDEWLEYTGAVYYKEDL